MQTLLKKITMLTAAGLLIASVVLAQSPNVNKRDSFPALSTKQLKMKWTEFQKDKAFTLLMAEVKRKGFKQVDNEKAQWGYEGELTDKAGKNQKVLFCIYDFAKPGKDKRYVQTCSMIWRKVGDSIYKAYVVLPEGVTNVEKALEASDEWYADEKGVHKANSWGKCFKKCVQTGGTAPNIDMDIKNGKLKVGGKTYTISCPGFCMFSAACAAVAVTVGVALSETGVGLAAAIVAAAACGAPCASCFGMCAIGCL
jgi:hypothetical protein